MVEQPLLSTTSSHADIIFIIALTTVRLLICNIFLLRKFNVATKIKLASPIDPSVNDAAKEWQK